MITAVAIGTLARCALAGPVQELIGRWEGKPAPALTLPDLEGKPFTLSSLRGNVVVLDVWASLCGPCVEAFPHINALAQDKERAARGLRVVTVNVGETKRVIEEFLLAHNYAFQVLRDEGGIIEKTLDFRGIPVVLVIDREQIVRKVMVGYGDKETDAMIDRAIDAALAAPANR